MTLQELTHWTFLSLSGPSACHLQVRMGFGLHVGWAIEGAIGSDYKIDASYLSPNVNMASRLEAATKQFGVTMLLSDDFVSLLSPGVRRRVRQVAMYHCATQCTRKPLPLSGIAAATIAHSDCSQHGSPVRRSTV
jgi:class 3 adenylate cyclase